jgi:D-alanyl-lipoteichoic acid acyltransferase DltB (MBOAT superfamily)
MASVASTPAASSERTKADGGISVLNLILVLGQLAVLLIILRQFAIESPAFLRLAALAFAGFAVHALLPLRYRLLFFVVLSFAAIAMIFGPLDGAVLVAVGLVLIGICHLPIRFAARVAVLLAVGAVLIAMRAKVLPEIWSDAIWPILGSMFMFRLIVYLYDLKHDSASVTPTRTLAYFFMLPNVCFPLFPVIDYKTFRRTYFDDDAYRIYQIGIDWMVRGVVHLLLYRYVYYYLTLSPAEVKDTGDLVQYCLSGFLLYLRVSGLFHLIVGMLYLFGFRLPETHHRYYLAAGFSDFWRRINIYWKDFMLKIFYYPTVFRFRHLGTTQAMILATMFVFLMTWFLHAYQWFWLRGTALFVTQDILFWAILGALVVVNALWELRHGRKRTLGKQTWTSRGAAGVALKTALTFSLICVLWSFWTTESLSAWLSLWTVVAEAPASTEPPAHWAVAFLALGAITQIGGAKPGVGKFSLPGWMNQRALTAVSLVVLLLAGIEGVHTQFGSSLSTTINSLRSGRLSRLDTAMLERGYYENLLAVNRFNSQLWEIYAKKPVNWIDVEGAGLKRFTDTFIQTELSPGFVAEMRFGPYSVNRWGMRDKDYEKLPAPGTFRIAILGASTIAGWGVGDGETFEALVEERMNRERKGVPFERYEILNFGVPGYQPPQQLPASEKALSFVPNAVIYVATGRETSRAADYLAEVVGKKIEIPYPALGEIVQKAGVDATMDRTAALRRLEPFKVEILTWVYRKITDESRARGATTILAFLPQSAGGSWEEETPEILRIAEASGFAVLNLSDVFKGHDLKSYALAEWDMHPTAFGHQIIAARLFDELAKRPDLISSKR